MGVAADKVTASAPNEFYLPSVRSLTFSIIHKCKAITKLISF